MAYVDTVNKNSTDYALSAFGNVFINNQNANVAKTIDYSNRGFDQDNDVNLTVKVVFQNGHVSADTTSNMTLNGKPILVNKDGALIKIPIQTLTEGGVTVYRTLQANTTLEMYYTKSVSGYSNGAYVVIGNPVVISSASYTIYADGYFEGEKQLPIGSIYQNKTDNRNPKIILGFGIWDAITDRFLIANGSTYHGDINGQGGSATYTLTKANIPQHTHGMQHYHYTDITHGHQVSDQGHFHTVPSARVVLGSDWGGSYPQNTYRIDYTYDLNQHTTTELTGIAVVDLPSTRKLSEGAIANGSGLSRTETDNWGTANPTEIDIIPPYQAIYTWVRTN